MLLQYQSYSASSTQTCIMTGNDRVQTGESSVEKGQPSSEPPRKKARKVPLKWSEELHRDFVSAIFEYGVTNASPAVILKQMMIEDSEVTSERVKSHLQKYRIHRDRSKQQFMTEYDESLRRIKERGGAKWLPTDKFSSGDVAAAMVYYSMHPEESITMPFDMRRSAVAGENNVLTARGGTPPSTGVTHDGAVYSNHRSDPNLGLGMPQSTANMHPAVATTNGGPSGAHQSNSRNDDPAARGDGTTISMPSLTNEEYNSPLGTTLRYLTGLCNSMTDHLLEIRHASSSAPALAPAETTQNTRQTSDNTMSGTHNSNTYPSQPPYNSTPGPYSHGSYPQHVHPGAPPIHPHGYMPPGGGAPPPPHLAPSYGYPPTYHHPLGHSHHGAHAPVPTVYSHQQYPAGSNFPYTSNSSANAGNETSNRGHDAKLNESKATPLYDSSRVRGDNTSDYINGGSGGDRSANSAAAVPPLSTKSSSSPAVSPTRSSTYRNNHSHSIPNSNSGNPSSAPNQGWGSANDGRHHGNDYSSAHNATYSYNHHPDDAHGGGSANQGQNNDSNNGNNTRTNQEYRQEQSSPTNMMGSLGDPWDEVPYSPIAH
mmetsp:Transcript_8199/g.17141  ORF Transcript_8199/g.17141 Transcript_8199/m.17141 type:complete len:596 (-) Transcript_8199:281-2068(-)